MSAIRIPPTLRDGTGGQREVEATGDTVRDLLEDLVSRFPSLRGRVYDDGEIAAFVNVYVGGEDVRTLDGLETPVQDGQTVILLPAMAGGLAPLAGIDSAGRRPAPPMRDAAPQEREGRHG